MMDAKLFDNADALLNAAALIDKTPKPYVFVMFVWELQKCLPTECRRHTESEVALSGALSLR